MSAQSKKHTSTTQVLSRQLGAAAAATIIASASVGEAAAQGQTATAPQSNSATPSQAIAPSDVQAALGKSVALQGRTTLRFLGLPIYDARLWTVPEQWQAARYATTPLALELQYRRRLEGKLIAERSIVEMRRVSDPTAFSAAQAQIWQTAMEQAFPNVVAGDRITGVHDGRGGVRFFHNGRATHQWQDAEFAKLFFGIWLSSKTSEPKLRLELLGAQ